MLDVEQERDGSFSVRMPAPALEFLQRVPDALRAFLDDPDASERLVARLFPAAYKDPTREEEYRELVGDDLRARKLEAIEVFENILADSRLNMELAVITIAAEHFHPCLRVVNDMRVLLGTALDIREDLWEKDLDTDDPQNGNLVLLHFLTFFEESLLQATGLVDLKIRPEDIS